MIAACFGKEPKIPATAWIAPSADVMGDVTMGEHSSVWFQAVVRGDVHWIKIGDYTNVQDGSVLHVTNGRYPLTIGSRVTIGHKALLHGCTVGDDCLIGMGAILLDDVEVGSGSVVAAGALLPPGKKYPPNSLILGSPAKAVRTLTPEQQKDLIEIGWQNYHRYVAEYRKDFRVIG
jgi:carbonic anhydrase/acetyltransferase-like protein (isoleucine patch superfamily)